MIEWLKSIISSIIGKPSQNSESSPGKVSQTGVIVGNTITTTQNISHNTHYHASESGPRFNPPDGAPVPEYPNLGHFANFIYLPDDSPPRLPLCPKCHEAGIVQRMHKVKNNFQARRSPLKWNYRCPHHPEAEHIVGAGEEAIMFAKAFGEVL